MKTKEELQEELRQAEADWDQRQNRVNELLSYLKVAQSHLHFAADRIEKCRKELYGLEQQQRKAEVN